MIEETLKKIETAVRNDRGVSEQKKSELLRLLGSLKTEISSLASTHAEHAESIAGFMERSTHEAVRREKNPTLLKLAVEGLAASVKDFEVSHPQLVEKVNYICTVLANWGL
jgi:predicted TIM-barrel enzyme